MDISEYKTVLTLQEFCEREKIDPGNARRAWAKGKRWYLKDNEDAKRLGRDWVILAK